MIRRLGQRQNTEQGFTITELVIAISVAAIMAVVLFTVTLDYYASAIRSHETAQMALESQSILSQMTEDLRLADGISTTNALVDDNNTSGWSTSDAANILIVQSPAVTNAREIIYDTSTGYPFRNEYVYFADGTNLYKRILKNTNATNNIAVTTCPVASSSCPLDRLYTTSLNDLEFIFYDASNAVTTTPSEARSVKVTVKLSKKVFGKVIEMSNSAQITQRNY
jgi:prepilin-type N-terminal cleavage/methylation domain-containing protein